MAHYRFFPHLKVKGDTENSIGKLGHVLGDRASEDTRTMTHVSFLDAHLAFDSPGVVKSWLKYGEHKGVIKFQVWRQVNPHEFLLVGENEFESHVALESFDVPEDQRILAQQGDIVGWRYETTPGMIKFTRGGSGLVRWSTPETSVSVGDKVIFSIMNADIREYSIQVSFIHANAVLNPSTSFAATDWQNGTEAGQNATFDIFALDVLGHPQQRGRQEWEVDIVPARDPMARVPVDVVDHDNGVYTVHYVPIKSGRHSISVMHHGKPIRGSPYAMVVRPGPPVANTTTASGPRLTDVVQDHFSVFQVHTHDALGNPSPVEDPAEQLECLITKRGSNVTTQVENGTSVATYDVSFVMDKTGDHSVVCDMLGDPIHGMPVSMHVRPDVTDPAQSVLLSKARIVVAGEQQTFVVQAVNATGDNRIRGRDDVTLTLTGLSTIDAHTTDHENGQYTLTWVALKAGTYTATVRIHGHVIRDGEFTVRVDPAALDRAHCVVEGEGHRTVTAGNTMRLTVLARDRFDNPRPVPVTAFEGMVTRLDTGDVINVTKSILPDHRVQLAFLATHATEHSFEVMDQGLEVPNSPVVVTVKPGPLSVPDTIGLGGGLTHSVAGYAGSFSVLARDKWQNNITTGGVVWDVVLTDPHNVHTKIALADKDTGYYAGFYNATTAGLHRLAITRNGVSIAGSPFTVTVFGAETAAQNSLAFGSGLSKATQDFPAYFRIESRDRFNNVVRVGKSGFVFNLVQGDTSVKGPVTYLGDGIYQGSYVAEKLGKYELHIFLRGVALKGSPFDVFVSPDVTVPSKSLATVSTHIIAGEKQLVDIFSRNITAERRLRGGDPWKVTLTGTNLPRVVANLIDHRNGSYTAEYMCTKAGEYRMEITLREDPIKQSPFTVVVDAAEATETMSTVEPPVATSPEGAVSVAGKSVAFQLGARDEFGNEKIVGGDPFTVVVHGPLAEDPSSAQQLSLLQLVDDDPIFPNVTIKDLGDGTYRAEFAPTLSGFYSVHISLEGKPVTGSPWTVKIAPTLPEAQHTLVEVEGNATRDRPGFLFLTPRDKYDNVVTKDVRAEDWLVRITGIDGNQLCQTNISGPDVASRFEVSYVCNYAGDVDVRVEYKGYSALIRRHLVIHVKPELTDATQSVAQGATLHHAVAGENSVFIIETKNRDGLRRLRGGDKFVILVDGPEEINDAIVADNEDGTYTVAYTITKAGAYTVTVTLEGTPIQNSGFLVNAVGGPADFDHTSIVTDDLANPAAHYIGEVVRGFEARVRLNALDKFGNVASGGLFDVMYALDGPPGMKIPGRVTQLESGKLEVAPTEGLAIVGNWTLSIKLDGKVLGGYVLDIRVIPDFAVAEYTVATGMGLTEFFEGEEALFVIHGRNSSDLPRQGGGDRFVVTVTMGSSTYSAKVLDNEDGSYNATYTLPGPGKANVSVTLDGSPIQGSPFAVTVKADVTDASRSLFTVQDDVKTMVAGTEVLLHIIAIGKNVAKQRTRGGDHFTLTTEGPTNYEAVSLDKGKGLYTIKFAPTIVGSYKLFVSVDSQDIQGSGAAINVTHGPASASASTVSAVHSVEAGKPEAFTVTSLDAWGNTVLSSGPRAVYTAALRLKGADNASATPISLQPLAEPGKFQGMVSSTVAGAYELVVLLDGVHVAASPFPVTVHPGPTDSATSLILLAPNATKLSTVALETKSLSVQARDRYGNARGVGGDALSVVVTGAVEVVATPVDHKDGTYTGTFLLPKMGLYEASVKLNGEDVAGTPVPVECHAQDGIAYHRLMTGPWLQSHATLFRSGSRLSFGEIIFPAGGSSAEDVEKLFEVPLLPRDVKIQHSNYTIRIRAALSKDYPDFSGRTAPFVSPVLGVSDGQHFVGFQRGSQTLKSLGYGVEAVDLSDGAKLNTLTKRGFSAGSDTSTTHVWTDVTINMRRGATFVVASVDPANDPASMESSVVLDRMSNLNLVVAATERNEAYGIYQLEVTVYEDGIYHQTFTPSYIKDHAEEIVNNPRAKTMGTDKSYLEFGTGVDLNDKLFQLPLVPAETLEIENSDYRVVVTVEAMDNKLKEGLVDEQAPIFGITDGETFVGFQRFGPDMITATGVVSGYCLSGVDGQLLDTSQGGLVSAPGGLIPKDATFRETVITVLVNATRTVVIGRTGITAVPAVLSVPKRLKLWSRGLKFAMFGNQKRTQFRVYSVDVEIARAGLNPLTKTYRSVLTAASLLERATFLETRKPTLEGDGTKLVFPPVVVDTAKMLSQVLVPGETWIATKSYSGRVMLMFSEAPAEEGAESGQPPVIALSDGQTAVGFRVGDANSMGAGIYGFDRDALQESVMKMGGANDGRAFATVELFLRVFTDETTGLPATQLVGRAGSDHIPPAYAPQPQFHAFNDGVRLVAYGSNHVTLYGIVVDLMEENGQGVYRINQKDKWMLCVCVCGSVFVCVIREGYTTI
eukprot:TRINITY_DN217_c0_g1_i1.p1 TRINITY_DN217_c0_g1~~TRINITY_DN217_c0_g1_i1.p1  ORF type:complete len:2666 (-),score=582.17 TRINITY_DN217_c0_g1_i1:103-7398(-)